MKLGLGLTVLAGLILAVALIAYHGAGAVVHAVAAMGWGILAITVFHLVPLACSALGWRALLRHIWRGSLSSFLLARWVREHVSHLLPVLQVGGELIGARLLIFRGAAPGVAGASVVVDLTLEAATQLVFTFLGLTILVLTADQPDLVRWVLIGLLLAVPLLTVFLFAQRQGLFLWIERLLEQLAKRNQRFSLGRLDNLHETILTLYRDHAGVAAASSYHFLCWVLGAGEVWLALYFMGHPITLLDALLLESLGEALRSVAFAIPGQLGVQEGGYMLLGRLVGLSPELGLALSLVKRVRILLIGLPALLTWQIMEGRRLLATRNANN
ncbi:MAG: flippase-like domain-containing protein [Nitrococcus mobilis]|nr:flippase-like domain-containing protein [Nitrococcus mobilis]